MKTNYKTTTDMTVRTWGSNPGKPNQRWNGLDVTVTKGMKLVFINKGQVPARWSDRELGSKTGYYFYCAEIGSEVSLTTLQFEENIAEDREEVPVQHGPLQDRTPNNIKKTTLREPVCGLTYNPREEMCELCGQSIENLPFMEEEDMVPFPESDPNVCRSCGQDVATGTHELTSDLSVLISAETTRKGNDLTLAKFTRLVFINDGVKHSFFYVPSEDVEVILTRGQVETLRTLGTK